MAEALLHSPAKIEDPQFSRAEATYDDQGRHFEVNQKDYSHQYFPIYNHRLSILKPALQKRAKEIWIDEQNMTEDDDEDIRIVERILDMPVGKKCVVVGTIYKHMPLLPTVLEMYAKEVRSS
jgi:DNA polymerase delta subunit 2